MRLNYPDEVRSLITSKWYEHSTRENISWMGIDCKKSELKENLFTDDLQQVFKSFELLNPTEIGEHLSAQELRDTIYFAVDKKELEEVREKYLREPTVESSAPKDTTSSKDLAKIAFKLPEDKGWEKDTASAIPLYRLSIELPFNGITSQNLERVIEECKKRAPLLTGYLIENKSHFFMPEKAYLKIRDGGNVVAEDQAARWRKELYEGFDESNKGSGNKGKF